MSQQLCTVATCKRVSRALCHCCQQNLCILHLNEHNDLLNSQLNPLTDEINTLSERLKRLNIKDVLGSSHQKLEEWRQYCYKQIDRFVDKNHQELDRLVGTKLNQYEEYITHIQSQVAELIRDQETTRQTIDMLTSNIRHLTKELDIIEQACITINTYPLLLNDRLIQIKINEYELDLSCLPPVCRTINRSEKDFRMITTNQRSLLMQQNSRLCLINRELTIANQTLDFKDVIYDMCWSSTLFRFIMIGKNNIYLVNENTMAIETIQIIEKRKWFSGTCSDTFLFLSTIGLQSSIVKFSQFLSVIPIKEWKSPETCAENERIDGIVYNNGTLGVMIANKSTKHMRIELRSSDTLDRIWTLPLDVVYNESLSNRCCSLNCDEWLIADSNAGRLLQITKDGKIKTIIPYKPAPYRVTLFDANILAVATENELNFHKI